MVKEITGAEFDAAVASGTAIVDFAATWCGPCKMLGPILDKFAAENPDIPVYKVDIDADMELAGKFGIMSIPAIRIFKDGNLAASFDGVTKADEIATAL